MQYLIDNVKDAIQNMRECGYFIADSIVAEILKQVCYPVLVHPSAILGSNEYVSIGEGSIICAGCLVTTNIRIGRHVLLNSACIVAHEADIGDYSAFMPICNISGEVRIGNGNFWGTGAKIINRCTVGENVVIGAGAVVITDIPGNVTAVGVPAKVVKRNKIS